VLVASATHDPASGATAIFALNRDLAQEQELRVELRGFDAGQALATAVELHHADLQASNTQQQPDAVAPRPHARVRSAAGELRAVLKPGSWNVFVLQGPRGTAQTHNGSHAIP